MHHLKDPSLTISPALPRGFSRPDDTPMLGKDCCDDAAPWWEAPEGQLYLAPAGFLSGKAAGAAVLADEAWPLAGGFQAFSMLKVFLRTGEGEDRGAGGAALTVAPLKTVVEWAKQEGEAVASHVAQTLDRLSAPRPSFAGLDMDGAHIMGILNVTPDSFSDGGRYTDPETAIAHGLAMVKNGATLIDVGGESTRPGAAPVTPVEEVARVVPVVKGLADQGAVVSIDTRHATVMRAAVEAGASIVNDVSALTAEPEALKTVADLGAPVVLMHMLGEPGTMQADPDYACAPLDIFDYLKARVAACLRAGIPPDRICVDPGIGFGKTVAHNLSVLSHLGLYHGLGVPLLLGASRKSMIAHVCGDTAPSERLPGSLAIALDGVRQGAQILRVHDVAETKQALDIASAQATA